MAHHAWPVRLAHSQEPIRIVKQLGLSDHVTTCFYVAAAAGDVAIALTNERGLDVPVKTVDNKDNTFRIEFEPTTVGTYTANVFFADQEIPSSPYRIQVEPTIDVGRVMVQGLDDSMY